MWILHYLASVKLVFDKGAPAGSPAGMELLHNRSLMQQLAPHLSSLSVSQLTVSAPDTPFHMMMVTGADLTQLTSLEVTFLASPHGVHLRDPLPVHNLAADISHLTNLRRLGFEPVFENDRGFWLSLPPQLSALQQLRSVTLSRTLVVLEELCHLPGLQELCIRHPASPADVQLPSSFGPLAGSLTRLDLDVGRLCGPYTSLSQLTCLRCLRLCHKGPFGAAARALFEGGLQGLLSRLTGLTLLALDASRDLASSRLRLPSISHLTRLERLHLCNFELLPAPCIPASLTALVELKLWLNNLLFIPDLAPFTGLTCVEVLFQHERFGLRQPICLAELPHLQRLTLSLEPSCDTHLMTESEMFIEDLEEQIEKQHRLLDVRLVEGWA